MLDKLQTMRYFRIVIILVQNQNLFDLCVQWDSQSINALINFVSAAHAALFSNIMSGAHASAHFSNQERRSR